MSHQTSYIVTYKDSAGDTHAVSVTAESTHAAEAFVMDSIPECIRAIRCLPTQQHFNDHD
jgi:hypothetical protein